MTGFYYHTDDFSGGDVAKKCAKRLDTIPEGITDVTVKRRDEVAPSELFGSNLTAEWVAPNYTDMVVEYDTPYSDLNEKSREKEEKRLKEQKGQMFVLEATLTAGGDAYPVSALIEIRGSASGGKTEFFIEEFDQVKTNVGT